MTEVRRIGWLPAFLGVVVVGSFAAGVMAPELGAQGGISEIVSSLRPRGNGKDLDPAQTYNFVLREVQEKFYGEAPNERKMTYTAVRGMLNTLDDPYTRFLDPDEYRSLREENTGEFEGIGAQLEGAPTKEGYIRISKPLPKGPADKAGVKRGDLISKVDGVSVVGLSVDAAVKKIRGRAGTTVRLTVLRKGEGTKEVAIVRQPVEYEVVEYAMKAGDIGYVSLAQFNELADIKIERAIRELEGKGMKGLVLDLRGNPGGLLDAAIDISSRFIPADKGVVIIVEAGGERDVRKTNPRKYLAGKWPLVVLVNRTSASASEIVSGAIKDNKTGTVIGTTTFGKGLVQTVVPLEDGSACMITTAKYLTPSGKDINRSRDQRGGVEPDVAVEVTEQEFLKGTDPQLQRAIETLHTEIAKRGGAKSPASATR
ncbi:MAG: S41 family peptidase [Actinomycetota bacterium]